MAALLRKVLLGEQPSPDPNTAGLGAAAAAPDKARGNGLPVLIDVCAAYAAAYPGCLGVCDTMSQAS